MMMLRLLALSAAMAWSPLPMALFSSASAVLKLSTATVLSGTIETAKNRVISLAFMLCDRGFFI
ncbi:MAG: hypothetical protein C4292_03120 [Nitrososphaera sp.]